MDFAAASLVRATRYEHAAASTGSRVELLDGERLPGHDPTAGRWLLRCSQHGTVTARGTKRAAEADIDRPQAWCDPCREVVQTTRRQRRVERLRAVAARHGHGLTERDVVEAERADREIRPLLTPAQRDELRDDEFVEELADDGWAATFDGLYIAPDGRRESRADLT